MTRPLEGAWATALTGRTVEAVERWEGGAWWVQLSGGYGIRTQSLWRLVSGGQLKLTSEDDGHWFGLSTPVDAAAVLTDAMVGQRVASVMITPGTADMSLSAGEYVLQVVAVSAGYEAWQVEGPNGIVAVGQGGGNVVVYGHVA